MRREKKGHESTQLGVRARVCVLNLKQGGFEVAAICVLSPTKVLRQWLHHRSIPLDDPSSLALSCIKTIPVDGEVGGGGRGVSH